VATDDILQACQKPWTAVSLPPYASAELASVLCGSHNAQWYSDPRDTGFPGIYITFPHGVLACLTGYSIASGVSDRRSHFLRAWQLYGFTGRKWELLHDHWDSDDLKDGRPREYAIEARGVIALWLHETGRNGIGSRQMHLTQLRFRGEVFLL
jgi:hypothetical protein